VVLALLAGFGFGALLSKGSMLVTSSTALDPTIDMAWQSGFRMNTLTNPSALPRSRVIDVRDVLRSSPAKKCVYVNRHASLCGDLVVLRPATALRATSGKEDSVSVDVDAVVKGVSEKFDSIEDKPQAALYAGGVVVAILFANNILSTIDSLPLIPKLLELVGTGYSAWFAYRYLLKKESRKELIADIETVKKSILD
jgi:hypothetical protein